MIRIQFLVLIIIFLFISCNADKRIDNKNPEADKIVNLEKLFPQNEDFAGEPLLVYFREKIETKDFNEFKKINLNNQPEAKQKVLKMILDEIEPLNFIKSVTGVYVEQSRNVTFSIVYFLFEDSDKASRAIPFLENLYTELIEQEFKTVNDKRILGDDQRVLYTMYRNIPVYIALYRRDNIVVLLFVPTKEVFPRVFPISSVHFPMEKNFYIYRALPDFAIVEKPTIAELKVPTDDYYIPNTSALRELAEERSKLWMDYFSKYVSNVEEVAKQFFALAEKNFTENALAYVDLRYTQNLIPQKFSEWYENEISKRIGKNIKVELISKKPFQPRYNKIFYEGGVRYQYPKLGFCDFEFRVSGSKQSRKAQITFSVFDKFLKIVDVKIL
ncbi:MAG: hypothetical protein ACPL25_04040 [Ignavibacteria bacterium]